MKQLHTQTAGSFDTQSKLFKGKCSFGCCFFRVSTSNCCMPFDVILICFERKPCCGIHWALVHQLLYHTHPDIVWNAPTQTAEVNNRQNQTNHTHTQIHNIHIYTSITIVWNDTIDALYYFQTFSFILSSQYP